MAEYGLGAELRESKKSTRFDETADTTYSSSGARGAGRGGDYGIEAELRGGGGRGGAQGGQDFGLEAEVRSSGARGGEPSAPVRRSRGASNPNLRLSLADPNAPPGASSGSKGKGGGSGLAVDKNTMHALPRQKKAQLTNTRYASNVVLQQMLYYNIFFSFCWFVAFVYQLNEKYGRGDIIMTDPDVVRIIMTVLWIPAEPFRIYSGYSGNLDENAPMLIMFMLLTLFPQAPIMFFFVLAAKHRTPFDQALSSAMAGMLVAEIVVGVWSVHRVVAAQTEQHYLQEFEQEEADSKRAAQPPNNQA